MEICIEKSLYWAEIMRSLGDETKLLVRSSTDNWLKAFGNLCSCLYMKSDMLRKNLSIM